MDSLSTRVILLVVVSAHFCMVHADAAKAKVPDNTPISKWSEVRCLEEQEKIQARIKKDFTENREALTADLEEARAAALKENAECRGLDEEIKGLQKELAKKKAELRNKLNALPKVKKLDNELTQLGNELENLRIRQVQIVNRLRYFEGLRRAKEIEAKKKAAEQAGKGAK